MRKRPYRGCPRAEENKEWIYGIKQPNETIIKLSRKVWRAGLGGLNGGEAGLDAPRNCEQNVNKGVDKKAEG